MINAINRFCQRHSAIGFILVCGVLGTGAVSIIYATDRYTGPNERIISSNFEGQVRIFTDPETGCQFIRFPDSREPIRRPGVDGRSIPCTGPRHV